MISKLYDAEDVSNQVEAVKGLVSVVDYVWAELADAITQVETLYGTESFPARHQAALLLSKIHFNLGNQYLSLAFALYSGSLVDWKSKTEYVQVLKGKVLDQIFINDCVFGENLLIRLGQAIDEYVKWKQDSVVKNEACKMNDGVFGIEMPVELLEDRIAFVLESCFELGQFHEALGLAVSAGRIDVCNAVLERVSEEQKPDILKYIYDLIMDSNWLGHDKMGFSVQVVGMLVEEFHKIGSIDCVFFAVACWIFLDDDSSCVLFLKSLFASEKQREENLQLVCQIALFVYENSSRDFVSKLCCALDEGVASDVFTGIKQRKLLLEFLSRNNQADKTILSSAKTFLNAKSSIHHSVLTISHSIMQCGTTNDDFLRAHMDFLSHATNWSKFIATAGLGVIHRGQTEIALDLLAQYLPTISGGSSTSAYAEGGSLFALGLITGGEMPSETSKDLFSYVLGHLRATQVESIQHGAALGLGLLGMSSCDVEATESLKSILFSDSAVAGEAAGISLGLLYLGSNNMELFDEMLRYAQETQHEKIIRGLSIGLALILAGKGEGSEYAIEQLAQDKEPLLRSGAMFATALAYAGMGAAGRPLRRLLHASVTDVSDEVRRASVTSIGLLLYGKGSQVIRLVSLLSESFNPHSRYGAAVAIGIACAGTASMEAIEILEKLSNDLIDFVRQGALVSLALVLMEHSDQSSGSKNSSVRALFEKIIANRNEDVMAKFGAVLGLGIIDAGGRNMRLRLSKALGGPYLPGLVGTALFSYHWSWYPMAHFLSLALHPTAIIGIHVKKSGSGVELKVPRIKFQCNISSQVLAYVPAKKPIALQKADKTDVAVLSTTAKAKARRHRKSSISSSSPGDGSMEVESNSSAGMEHDMMPISDVSMETHEVGGGGGSDDIPSATLTVTDETGACVDAFKKTRISHSDGVGKNGNVAVHHEKEPHSTKIENFSRLLPVQWQQISWGECSYRPLVKDVSFGLSNVFVLDVAENASLEYIDDEWSKDQAACQNASPSSI